MLQVLKEYSLNKIHEISVCYNSALTICLLGNFSCLLLSADFFQNHFFFGEILSGSPSVSNNLDPDQA